MQMNKLKIATAMSLLFSSGYVCAAPDAIVMTGGGTANIATVSTDANLEGLSSTANQVGTITTSASLPSLLVNDILTITVEGAKFDRSALSADPVAITKLTGTTAAIEDPLWVLDAATDTILTSKITTASTNDVTGDVITLTGKYDLKGTSANTTPQLIMTVERKVLGLDTIVYKNTTKLDLFNVTGKLQDLATVTPVDGIVKVEDIFKKIDGNLVHTIANGKVDTAVKLDSNATAGATGTSLFTLTGLPTATTKVTWGTTTGAFSQKESDGITDPGTNTVDSTFYLDGAGNGYALLDVTGAKALFNDNAALIITVNGTDTVPTTKVKLSVDYLAGAGDDFTSHSILAPTTVASLVRDGSSFSVNSSGALNKIKVTDASGGITASTGNISVTAYDGSGAEISGTITFPKLESNGTVVIQMADVLAAFSGALRFDFTVESTEIIASNIKKSADGITSTTYRNSTGTATKSGSGAL